jgi:hypothetical protein
MGWSFDLQWVIILQMNKQTKRNYIMKNNLITATALALTLSACATAQTSVSNSEYSDTCKGTLDHARNYASKEKLTEVLDGQWKIITSENVNDMGKLAGLTIFNIYQRAAYNWDVVVEQEGGVEKFEDSLFTSCIDMLETYEVVKKSDAPASTKPTYESIY